MKDQLTLSRYVLISAVILTALLANWFIFGLAWTGVLFTGYYLLFYGFILGFVVLPEERGPWQTFFGTLLLVATISAASSAVYFFYRFDATVILGVTLAVPLALLAAFYVRKRQHPHKVPRLPSGDAAGAATAVLAICFAVFTALSAYEIFSARTGAAIRSPWWVVGDRFFITYFLASATLVALALRNRRAGLTVALATAHAGVTLTVATVVYQIGYGFDPFIHQATEKTIAALGAIEPKPLYYLGQYTLVVWLSEMLSVAVETVDKLLVPLLATLTLPAATYYAWQKNFSGRKPGRRRDASLVAVGVLLLPLSSLIVTTPQGLANLMTLLMVILSLSYVVGRDVTWLKISGALAVATMAIHPLSGLPAAVFVLLLLLTRYLPDDRPWDRYVRLGTLAVLGVLFSLLLPIVFVLNGLVSPSLTVTLQQPAELAAVVGPYLRNHFNVVYDLVYWQGFNVAWLLVVAAALGMASAGRPGLRRRLAVYPATFAIVALNFFFVSNFLEFSSLIDYEQGNFSVRLLTIALYFLAPPALYGLYRLGRKVRAASGGGLLRLGLVATLAIALTSQVYLLYPRDDDYHLDRGYNVTAADVDAVRFVHADAGKRGQQDGGRYIVLANQITSVAAVREYGFINYYPAEDGSGGTYFYYPIPTGDPLYQQYLAMVYTAAERSTVHRAMDLVGADLGYFIISSYWDEFDRIVEEAKASADSWQSIAGGQSYVFTYAR